MKSKVKQALIWKHEKSQPIIQTMASLLLVKYNSFIYLLSYWRRMNFELTFILHFKQRMCESLFGKACKEQIEKTSSKRKLLRGI